MSWFDTSGIASLAKTALKEAQKTIDKALDIQDDDRTVEQRSKAVPAPPANTPIVTTDPDFFSTWGLGDQIPTTEPIVESPVKQRNTTSLWGSFAGSFFEPVQNQLDDTEDDSEKFNDSKLVVRDDDPTVKLKNRLSIISNSSDSVELLETPESESSGIRTSDSVEIIPSSNSIEVLTSESTDEFISPTNTSESISKISPESIEVIPEEYDDEEASNADESYASFSESTLNTVLEPVKLDGSPEKSSFGDIITHPPSKTGMHLVFANPSSKEVLIDTQPQGSNQSITALVESPNVINPNESELLVIDRESSEQTSGGENDNAGTLGMESSTETVTTTESSIYVKNLLADAMMEKSIDKSKKLSNLERSPLSSESRSEIIKIESEHTSDQTSGDELETTTSSDIEIISSPNGDSSSTQSVSRQSPAKLFGFKGLELVSKSVITKIKGHNRELSETSSDDSCEVDRLLKRISEMTEILEARETKLIDLNRQNLELVEGNNALKLQMDQIYSKQLESADVNQVTEEYTQRMSALERKFQQAIRERDSLKKQVEGFKKESATRTTRNDLEVLLKEKDDTIKELREEGEKLSKVQLHHTTIIKKLRAAEKDQSLEIKRLRDQIEELQTDLERTKKSLASKEKLERTQVETIHQLTSKSNKLERENSTLKSQLDDTTQRLETTKTSLEAAKKELSDKKNTSHELQVREKALAELETSKRLTQSQNEEILNQLEDLRDKLRETELEHSRKEKQLRDENTELLRRLESSEARNEELAESVSIATKPLIRQLDTLQSTYSFKQSNWEKQEQELVEKLHESQRLLSTLTENEGSTKQECSNLKSRISTLESSYNSTLQDNDRLSSQVEELQARQSLSELETHRLKTKYEDALAKANKETQLLQNEMVNLNQLVEDLKKALEVERNKFAELQEHVQRTPPPRDNSPTLSLGRVSLSESLGSLIWPQDDTLDCGASASGRYSTVYDSVRGNPTAVLENLQSTIKLRDGEIQQLQWEMSRRDNERTLLTNELALLTSKLDSAHEHCRELDGLKEQFEEISQKYDAMCQMYGEKVEEVQELRLDLQDVKEMYKIQIDELLNKQKG